MQILILGTHRSGTSMVTRLINMMGAYFAAEQNSIGFNEENPKGFWERKDVVEWNKRIMERLGCSWDEVSGFPFADMPKLTPEEEKSLKHILLELDAHRPWVVKDPRLCLTLPLWKNYLESPVAVMVHRDPLEVAKSLHTRNAIPMMCGVAIWEYYTVASWNASSDMPRVMVNHSGLLADPIGATRKLYEGLSEKGVKGLHLPVEQDILAFVEPQLYRSKTGAPVDETLLNREQCAWLEIASGKKPAGDKPLAVSRGGATAMKDYAQVAALRKEKMVAEQNAQALTQKLTLLQRQSDLLAQETQTLRMQQDKLVGDIEAMRASTSWKIGNGLVRAGRKVLMKD